MSYLTDEPLTNEEESIISREEHRYNIDHPPLRSNIKCPYTSNRYIEEIQNMQTYQYLYTDYFKIDIRNNHHSILLNTSLLQRLSQAIKRRCGEYPINGSLICTSIIIKPAPKHYCSIYYQEGFNEPGDKPQFELIGRFKAPDREQLLSVSCPFTDSSVAGNKLIFNWFTSIPGQPITPRTIVSDYVLPWSNTNLAWLCKQPLGSYYIEGICDFVGFNVTYASENDRVFKYRKGSTYNRRKKIDYSSGPYITRQKFYDTHSKYSKVTIPRQVLGQPGEIQYEIPTQEFYVRNDYQGEDPIFQYLK